MVSQMKKVITAPSACGQQHGQATSSSVDVADGNGAAASSVGLDLLVYASRVDNDSSSSSHGGVPGANGSGDVVEAASFDSNSTKNSTAATINQKATDVIACMQHLTKNFPQVLHEILSTPEYEAIIHWLPDGSSFIIVDRHRFAEEVLPKYFRKTSFHSFIRKLYRWGFYQVNGGCKEKLSTSSIWYSRHSCFLRDHPELCLNMKCRQTPTKVLPSVKREQQVVAAAASNSIKKKAQQESDNVTATQHMNALTSRILSSSFYYLAASGGSDAINPTVLACLPALPTATAPSPLTLTSKATVATISPLTLPTSRNASITITSKDREFLSSIPPSHQERLFKERQLIIAKMHQRKHLQMELKRLNDMSLQYLQSSIEIQYDYMLQRGALSTEEV